MPAERNTPRGVRRGPLTPLRRRASRGSRSADRGESSGAADRERGPGARALGRARRWSLGAGFAAARRASFVSAKGGHRPEETGTPTREFDSPATTRAFARRPRPRARPRSRARSGFESGSSACAPSLARERSARSPPRRLRARGEPLLASRSSLVAGERIHTSARLLRLTQGGMDFLNDLVFGRDQGLGDLGLEDEPMVAPEGPVPGARPDHRSATRI